MMLKHYTIFLMSIISFSLLGQSGGLQYTSEEAMDGYTMFETFSSTYLVDNCGRVVNEWLVSDTHLHTKLTRDGNLMYIRNGVIYVKNWDDELIEFVSVDSDENLTLVYEVIELPNQNFLAVARQYFDEDDFEAIGYEFQAGESAFFMDAVVEIDRFTSEIVWKWSIADHVIQERDSSAANYGSIEDNPQLLNMDAIATFDWTFEESFMINGMDYNPELDHIVLSVRKMSEVVIIDHSTTTEQAAGSTGGSSGKGGDILYRWGNQQNYGRGIEANRELYFQHNPNWIHHGEHSGKIILFNNGLSRQPEISEGIIIDPPYDPQTRTYHLEDGEAYLPDGPTKIYSHSTASGLSDMYSGYTSGAKVLSNGNILITEGDDARLHELTPDGQLAWQYDIPVFGYIFRGEKYAADYPGLEGKDLTPGETVEFPSSQVECDTSTISSTYENLEDNLTLQSLGSNAYQLYNPSNRFLHLAILNTSGQTLWTKITDDLTHQIDLSTYPQGVYIIQCLDINEGRKLENYQILR